MISDVLFEAIEDIEEYQRNFPDAYTNVKDHIELVKHAMASLMNTLDEPPGYNPKPVKETLSEIEKQWWQVTCEANIARWVERLRLLGPVSSGELLEKLEDAIERQEIILSQKQDNEETEQSMRRRLFAKVRDNWNESATSVAGDALKDILEDCPEEVEELVGPIVRWSDYWLEQIARAAFGLPSDDTRDFEALLEMNCRPDIQPFVAEAFDLLLNSIQKGQPVPREIELELEDDNSITWDLAALIEAAKSYTEPLSASMCEILGLPEGSGYADAALWIESDMKVETH